MIVTHHEEPNVNVNSYRSKPRAFTGHDSANSGGCFWNKDSGLTTDIGGSASGMDSQSLGLNAAKLEFMDAQSERAGVKVFGTGKEAWTPGSFNLRSAKEFGRTFREVSVRVWVKPGPVGRSHPRGSSKAPLGDKGEGSSGSELDAPIGVSAKKGWLHVSSGTGGRGQAISQGFKKNFGLWDPGRRLSLRTRQDLRCIHVWE